MKNIIFILFFLISHLFYAINIYDQYLIYDDRIDIEVYSKSFLSETEESLITMIKDREGSPYKRAAAVSALRENFFSGLNVKENLNMQDTLRGVFRYGGSSFIRIEIAYALCRLDREKYFKDMVPFLLRRIDNENNVVSERAFDRVNKILNEKAASMSEAKIVLQTIKKICNACGGRDSENPDLRTREKQKLFVWAEGILTKKE